MRPLLGVLFSIVAICVAICAEMLTPTAFTEEFARALTRARPSANVSVVGDLRLTIKEPDGLQLGNAYSEYKLDPGRFDDLVERLATIFWQPADKAAAGLDRTRIVPVIKDRQWLDELHNTLKARGTPQQHLAERYNNELVIVYAQDDPNRMRYLTVEEDFGLSREALKALAIDNLKRLLPKIQILVYDEVMLVSAGGDYEASLLLIDELWTGGQIKVDGDIVVAIPARDVLLITGSRNRAGLKKMRELTAKAMAQGPYELTDTLFRYRDGRFTKFGSR
jgi:uncharacterized protein YtpQ (UPF0354 family)